jgi:hypothetical protein
VLWTREHESEGGAKRLLCGCGEICWRDADLSVLLFQRAGRGRRAKIRAVDALLGDDVSSPIVSRYIPSLIATSSSQENPEAKEGGENSDSEADEEVDMLDEEEEEEENDYDDNYFDNGEDDGGDGDALGGGGDEGKLLPCVVGDE